MSTFKDQSSFTLIELLIVIGILAILAAVVIIVLNPQELLKQARDSRRLSDLNSLNKALTLYQTDRPGTFMGTSSIVYVSIPDASSTCANLGLPSLPSGWSYNCVGSSSLRKVDGNGWVPVSFTSISWGSPVSTLPIDPVNTTSTGNYYTYVVGGSWKMGARLESDKYTAKAGKDGGPDPALYEIGNNLDLAPFLGGMVGWWKFDETGTTANDSSGYSNTGTMYSSSTITDLHTTSNCRAGTGCGSFDGIDDYVDLPYSVGIQKSTVTAWVKGTNFGSRREIINFGGALFNVQGANICVYYYGVTTAYLCGSNVQTNTWVFVSATYNGTIISTYNNGLLSASTNKSGTVGGGNSSLGFCKDCGVGAYYFLGLIDDVRIYNRALSAAEIAAIYNATK